MVFSRREFIERTRLFVPVSLDGDDPGAQKLGERFDVEGYPTTIVFSPDGDEITRLSLGLDLERYLEALDAALAASRAAGAAYDAVLQGDATAADYRLLAYYSGVQDRERLVPAANLPEALKDLHALIPDDLAMERALLFTEYLRAYRTAARAEDREPTLTAEDRPAAQEWMIEILRDPELTAAVQLDVVYGAHRLLPLIAQPDDPGRADLEAAGVEGGRRNGHQIRTRRTVRPLAAVVGTLQLPSHRADHDQGFRELSDDPDTFFLGVTGSMERLETALYEWNSAGSVTTASREYARKSSRSAR